METLNLMYPEESEIEFKISHFPDGQQNIDIKSFKESVEEVFWAIPGRYSTPHNANTFRKYEINNEVKVQIKSRFNSFKDLELIICAIKALRRLGVKDISLYIPYLLGARSDRQFVEGGNSYLVDVIAPIINSLEFESVTVVDVHSDVAAACIKNLKSLDNVDLVNKSLYNISTLARV